MPGGNVIGAKQGAAGAHASEPEWLVDGVSAAARERLKRHPGFAAAMTTSAASLVELYSGNRLLNRVLNDRGRTLFGFFALYLHALPDAAGGGLTVGHMAALAAETGVCSRGRAKAMLALMRWGGYLAPAEETGDRRAKPLVPTARMLTLHRQRWMAQYRTIATLDPEMSAVEALLEAPWFFNALAIALGDSFRSGYRVLDYAPRLAGLADRDSGLMVLLSLLAAEAAGRPSPSIADLARRFHVSRAHVLQLLKDAQLEGLVERDDGGGGGRLTPSGHAALGEFFAATFALLCCAAKAAMRHGRTACAFG